MTHTTNKINTTTFNIHFKNNYKDLMIVIIVKLHLLLILQVYAHLQNLDHLLVHHNFHHIKINKKI